LLLQDVLGWSAADTAQLLEASPASVYSALRRARATLARRFPTGRPAVLPWPNDRQRALLQRYVAAWERADLDGFVALLRADAVLSMPPRREWYRGREAIRVLLAWVWGKDGPGRLVWTAANGQPAFAHCGHGSRGGEQPLHAIQVLTLDDDVAVAKLTFFLDRRLFVRFRVPAAIAAATPATPP
jgi:RNA polymerase sigma-70 factor (ECF subfamily)